MTTTLESTTPVVVAPESVADVLRRLGDVPIQRLLVRPHFGDATPRDVLQLRDRNPKRLCELVDGYLVEKAMGHKESRIAAWIIWALQDYLREHNLGVLSGADGPHLLDDDLVRYPDVAFIAWKNIPTDADPDKPLPDWIPTLAVEVLSESNTSNEMQRKLRDYFTAGVEMVWYVSPADRTVRVYSDAETCVTLTEADVLNGEPVLPGFRVAVRDLFAAGELRRPPASMDTPTEHE